MTAERQAKDQPHLSPACKLCLAPVESPEHVIISCQALADIRQRLFPELMNVVASVYPASLILQYQPPSQLAQFIVDCTSNNLHDGYRIPAGVRGSGVEAWSRVCQAFSPYHVTGAQLFLMNRRGSSDYYKHRSKDNFSSNSI